MTGTTMGLARGMAIQAARAQETRSGEILTEAGDVVLAPVEASSAACGGCATPRP